MNYFFTSDLHFGHFNIIKYCNRPFSSIEEMNEVLISNYNSVVSTKDTTYILGDFSMKCDYQTIHSLMNRLNGYKVFILGNHDNENHFIKMRDNKIIESLHQTLGKSINSKYIWMSHYAHRVWNRSHKGSWHIYGHSHATLPSNGLSYDVGVDNNNYYPVSFDSLSNIFNSINENLLEQNTTNL